MYTIPNIKLILASLMIGLLISVSCATVDKKTDTKDASSIGTTLDIIQSSDSFPRESDDNHPEQKKRNETLDRLHDDITENPSGSELLNIASLSIMELAKFAMQHDDDAELPTLGKSTPAKTTKKTRIIFTAMTDKSTPINSTMNYTKSSATDGNPVNSSSGIYTVQTSGLYGFIFHAVTNNITNHLPTVQLRVNDATVATAAAYHGGSFKAMTLIAGAKLKRDDQVAIFVTDGVLFENTKANKSRASFAGTFMN